MKNEKPTLIFIIILCIISIPLAIYSVILKKENNKLLSDPAKGEFFYEGTLNFYNNNKELIGKYECVNKTKDKCKYATSTLEEKDNTTKAITDKTINDLGLLKMNNSYYAFIEDGENVFLYSINLEKKIIDFDAINFYNNTLYNDSIFIKVKGKWGTFSLKSMTIVIPCEYDYLSLIDNYVGSKLDASVIIANKLNTNSLINENNEEISSYLSEPIYTFNNAKKLIITKANNNYNIYNFEGNQLLNSYLINYAYVDNSYLLIVDNFNTMHIFKDNYIEEVFNDVVSTYKEITIDNKNNEINILIDGKFYKKLEV